MSFFLDHVKLVAHAIKIKVTKHGTNTRMQ